MSGIVPNLSKPLPPKGKALNDYTWEEISMISSAGKARSYFSVGDRKAITLNGTVVAITFSNVTYYAYIIGIDHNASIEGSNRIHFQFAYSDINDGTNLAFATTGYNGNYPYATTEITMNDTNASAGGWKDSKMRNTICSQFKNALPLELQSVLKTVTKYSDNTGGSSSNTSYVTATTDTIFLLSEYEVYGQRQYANTAEQTYQSRYAYYAAGNTMLKKRHYNTSYASRWWLRSTVQANTYNFVCVNDSGSQPLGVSAADSSGLAPAFCV